MKINHGGKKIERPKMKSVYRKQEQIKGKFVRGKACSKCKQMRPYCKCDSGKKPLLY
jgi:hypothetical protein|tara:strand:+ start:322 stop:492 length:171 start_codon:yes stop_codon:yes gene_type:complete